MIQWNEDQRALRDAALGLGKPLSAGYLERDAGGEFPREQWRLLAESGLLGLPVDGAWGGLGQDLTTTMHVLEGLGEGCRDTGLSFSACTHLISTCLPVDRFGSDALKEHVLTAAAAGELIGAHAISEPEAGSDMLALRTRAEHDGDDLVINGHKAFVTNGPVADLYVVYVKTDPGAGAFGITAVVVERDRPGLTIGRPMQKMGLRSSPLGELFFDDCRVPARNVLGDVGSGFAIFDHVMKWEVLCSFAVNVGEMQHRLERTVDYVRSRRQFGRHIGSYQSVAHRVVEMRMAVDTARRALYDAAVKVQRDEDATVDVAIAKLLASEGNLSSAVNAVQIFGGYGYMTEYGLEHDVRSAMAGTIYSGTTDIQRNRIASMMGLEEPAPDGSRPHA
ncbi:acyl-CoA dehydrogenase family protein [Streptomyces sp. NPDC054855]